MAPHADLFPRHTLEHAALTTSVRTPRRSVTVSALQRSECVPLIPPNDDHPVPVGGPSALTQLRPTNARTEIHRALRPAAWSLLDDVDAALRRIGSVTSERSHPDGNAIARYRLTAPARLPREMSLET